ncbi:DUF6455 family protein [Marivita sp. S0852]|uniref:DUF6455 family protein n=1 Tax=Marivita sp. S0852 TaxID=3373893 RepID=UPI0039825C17
MTKFQESCVLTQGMADRLGKEIPDSVSYDPERQAVAYRSAVLLCNSCGHHEDCKTLQSENDTLDQAPSYCRNAWG